MNRTEELQNHAVEKFQNYLKANNMRQTSERFRILLACYATEGFFKLNDLQQRLEEENFHVSIATLYANTALFVEANLLIRHPFHSQETIFERVNDSEPRSYQICTRCNKITKIIGEDVREALKVYKPRRFAVSHRIYYVYGLCTKCQTEMKKNSKIKYHEKRKS